MPGGDSIAQESYHEALAKLLLVVGERKAIRGDGFSNHDCASRFRGHFSHHEQHRAVLLRYFENKSLREVGQSLVASGLALATLSGPARS
jgi:hypothetical protein